MKDVEMDSLAIRRRVGYLAQHPRFYDYMSPREILRLSGRFFIEDQTELEQRISGMLDLVGLSDKADRKIDGLSGGEIHRLGIAQAQIHEPDLLILDEPAAALDPMGREKVLSIMEQLRERSTIFFSTHILDDVQRVSDVVAILNRGQLIAQAPIDHLLSGTDGTVYKLSTSGNHEGIRQRMDQQSWISGIEFVGSNETGSWRIMVSDDDLAEQQLLRIILADEQARVLEFGREKIELEDVFMQLVSGDD
jgi:ABC-2 type transport system ATP-binding protein